jgi:hypothetical protein
MQRGYKAPILGDADSAWIAHWWKKASRTGGDDIISRMDRKPKRISQIVPCIPIFQLSGREQQEADNKYNYNAKTQKDPINLCDLIDFILSWCRTLGRLGLGDLSTKHLLI